MSKRKEPDEAVEARLAALAAEIEQPQQKPDNSFRPLITGWALWWRCTFLAGEGTGVTYHDPALPACPNCRSPNVRLLRTRKKDLNRYWCLDCKRQDSCVLPLGASTGIEARRAQIKMRIILLVLYAVLAVIMWLSVNAGIT